MQSADYERSPVKGPACSEKRNFVETKRERVRKREREREREREG